MDQDSSPREEQFKQQAKRLRAFLAVAGIDIKHMHSLEAVAQMHGAKDFHSLLATAPPEPEGLLDNPFVSVTLYDGYSDVSLAPTRELGLRSFLQTANMLVDLLGGDDAEVLFVGQDLDSGLPSLALTINGAVWATLDQPSQVEDATIQQGNDGQPRLVPGKKIAGLEEIEGAESFFSIAVALTNAFASRKKSEQKPRAVRATHTLTARLLAVNFNEALMDLATETHRSMQPVPLKGSARALLKAIDQIKLLSAFHATVRGSE